MYVNNQKQNNIFCVDFKQINFNFKKGIVLFHWLDEAVKACFMTIQCLAYCRLVFLSLSEKYDL